MASAFDNLAPRIMGDLIHDFGLTPVQAAGVVGNLGTESGGFKHMQELKPTVAGSRGGYGWAQWTGPRRRLFEAWVKGQGFDPTSYAANYGFLKHELLTTHKKALTALKATTTLSGAVRAFEKYYEGAGVKNYASRDMYAARALALANTRKGSAAMTVKPVELIPEAKSPLTSKSNLTNVAGVIAMAVTAWGLPITPEQQAALITAISIGWAGLSTYFKSRQEAPMAGTPLARTVDLAKTMAAAGALLDEPSEGPLPNEPLPEPETLLEVFARAPLEEVMKDGPQVLAVLHQIFGNRPGNGTAPQTGLLSNKGEVT